MIKFLSKTARNIIKVSIGDIISKVFSVGSVLILIRGLSVVDYSAYIFISSVGNYLSNLIGSGINLSLVRYSLDYTSRYNERPKVLYKLAILFQIVIFLILSAVSFSFNDSISSFLFGHSSIPKGLLFGILFGIGLLTFNYCRSIYQAEEQFNALVLISWLMQSSVFILFLVALIIKNLSVEYVSVVYSFSYLIISLFVFLNKKELFAWRDLSQEILVYKELIRNFFKASGWLIGYFFMLALISRLDIFFLTRYAAQTDVATYGVALQYYNLGLLLLGSINAVLLPRFSHVEMQSMGAQRGFLYKWLKFSVWIFIPILVFDLFGRSLFSFINGTRYDGAFTIFIIFSLGIFLSLILSPLTNILIGKGDLRFLFVISAIALVVNVVGNYLFVPLYRGSGAAVVLVLTYNIVIQVPVLLRSLNLIKVKINNNVV